MSGMSDPPRLRSESGTLSALLLKSAPDFEPPPSAQEEVWRRLQMVTAVGVAAGATGLAAHAAASAGAKIVSQAVRVGLIKWGAIVAIGAPAVGMTTHWVLNRHDARPIAPAAMRVPESLPKAAAGNSMDVRSTRDQRIKLTL